jgi:hypothetical protein
VELSGYTGRDLAGSAKGTLDFDWRHGAVSLNGAAALQRTSAIPPALAHFDEWTAAAVIGDNAITLGQNKLQAAGHKRAIEGTLTFADTPEVRFSAQKTTSPEPH